MAFTQEIREAVERVAFQVADGHGEASASGDVSPQVYETARRAAVQGALEALRIAEEDGR